MKEERYHLTLDRYDKNIVINALNTLRTQQIQEERPTDPVDELISKVAHAPTKKVRVVQATAANDANTRAHNFPPCADRLSCARERGPHPAPCRIRKIKETARKGQIPFMQSRAK